MFKGIFVDDLDNVYAELLSDEKITFSYQGLDEIMELRRILLDAKPHIVALDYRLDQHLAGLPPSKAFKGGPLAQLLRDAAIDNPEVDFPIVLVSSEQNIKQRFAPDKTAHDLFDEVMYKEELQASSERAIAKMIALCESYTALVQMQRVYDITAMVDLPKEQHHVVDHQELTEAVKDAAAPHIVSRIFSKLLTGRTGLLIDDNELLARFGVGLGFAEQAAEVLTDHGVEPYKGLFASESRRWWAHQVDAALNGIFGKRATGLTSAKRAEILNQQFEKGFAAAESPWVVGEDSTKELIAFACSCCGRGTELRHSLAVYEPPQPSFVAKRRICWDCIQSDNYKNGSKTFEIQESDKSLIPQILAARQ